MNTKELQYLTQLRHVIAQRKCTSPLRLVWFLWFDFKLCWRVYFYMTLHYYSTKYILPYFSEWIGNVILKWWTELNSMYPKFPFALSRQIFTGVHFKWTSNVKSTTNQKKNSGDTFHHFRMLKTCLHLKQWKPLSFIKTVPVACNCFNVNISRYVKND